MAKFKYVGDPNDRFSGGDVVVHGKKTFVKNEVVDYPEESDEDKEVVRGLKGHSHFVDMSDKDESANVAARQKALEKADADKEKAEEAQHKKDDADRKQMLDNQAKAARSGQAVTSENAPRPPGTVTREPVQDAFQGRTVEQRTPAEDHTKAGKTKS
ncbi:MAG: hypothetical protein H0U63_04625 [Burkholderiales bacterium]|nr:hypothetical protein [Burkholderiales bacterium]